MPYIEELSTGTAASKSGNGKIQTLVLPSADQGASRVTFCSVQCFPLDKARTTEALDHLHNCTRKLAALCPLLAGRVRLQQQKQNPTRPQVVLDVDPSQEIPFLVEYTLGGPRFPLPTDRAVKTNNDNIFDPTYAELRQEAFPAKHFIDADLFSLDADTDLTGSGVRAPISSVPVLRVQVILVAPGGSRNACPPPPSGLLLALHFHHSVVDGALSGRVIEAFAALTKGEDTIASYLLPRSLNHDLVLPSPHTPLLAATAPGDDLKEEDNLIRSFPEYEVLPPCFARCPNTPFRRFVPGSGQTSPPPRNKFDNDAPLTHEIWRFSTHAISRLQDELHACRPAEPRPTGFVALASLVWAAKAKAYLDAAGSKEGDDTSAQQGLEARLCVPVNWRDKVFTEATARYLGNTTLFNAVDMPLKDLIAAAATSISNSSPTSSSSPSQDDLGPLSTVAATIQASLACIDAEWVARRNDLFARVDPRRLGLDWDRAAPGSLLFNTWRHHGSAAAWAIPGVETSRPDAIRSAHIAVGQAEGLMQPTPKDAGYQEVMLSLPQPVMDAMEKNTKLMALVWE